LGSNLPPPLPIWKKGVYRLAVIPVEFPDVKHNEAIPLTEWEEMFFSTGTYAGKNNATGQPVYGSMEDYYREVSCGGLQVEGRVFAWVQAGRKRPEYPALPINPKQALLTEVLDHLLEREGDDCLSEFDGFMFIYAGDRFPTTNRGSVFWSYRSSVVFRGKSRPYFICPEGGQRMGNISVFCHEFGHMLGLPDLYARPENPGSEGLGAWCIMSQQAGGGQPQHFCAWSKEQLGWLKPAVVDPTIKQKLILSPIEGTTNQCFKILIRPDGSEYLLLENRRRQRFDQRLPAEGLLIWHVVGKRPILEESHGVEGPAGPLVFLKTVPYPSDANDAFTPYTTPSSRSQLGGGVPVHITNIRKLPDGRITFFVGYIYE
jgi:M6 family metalloprotease-like protein